MKHISILDASLRDGGHRTNFHFKDEELQNILKPLDSSGVDYIEIGYRNGSLCPDETQGRASLCSKDYLKYCQPLIKKAKIAVMVYPHRVHLDDLNELQAYGVELLRICIAKNGITDATPMIQWAKKLNLKVSLNFINLADYTDNELDKTISLASLQQPDILYFADSNGALLPEKVKAIYEKYTPRSPIPFGFHAHDNLGLAQANSIAAMNAGAQFIDASLAGMGKGTGNLKTEFFIAYLHAIHIKNYNLQDALTAANYVRQALHIGTEPLEINEFLKSLSRKN